MIYFFRCEPKLAATSVATVRVCLLVGKPSQNTISFLINKVNTNYPYWNSRICSFQIDLYIIIKIPQV